MNVAWKLYAPAASGPSVFEFGADPPVSVPPPAAVPVPAVQLPLVKKVYATDPVAVKPSDGVTVAVSYADAPVVSFPDHAALLPASSTVVDVVLEPEPTVNGSHALVDPPKLLSPDVYFAWKLYDPAASGPFVFEFGAAPPLSAPPPADVPVPEHVLLLKNV